MIEPPAFLAIGHLTRDRQPDGTDCPGGSVLYTALTARRLGLFAAAVTAAEDIAYAEQAFAGTGVLVACRSDGVTTTFANRYVDGRRTQWLLAVGRPLGLADVPADWRQAALVLLAPVAGEVDPSLAEAFPAALVGATVQGWLRDRAPDGRVRPATRPIPELVLARADVIVVSDEDLGPAPNRLAEYAQAARLLVVTHGAAGATLYVRGRPFAVPAFPAAAVDPTGAGDVFAAALLVRLGEGAAPCEAARFASAAASCAVEAPGTHAVPTRAEVARRLARAPQEGTDHG